MRLDLGARRIERFKRNHSWRPTRSGELTDDVKDEYVLKPLGYLKMGNALRSNELTANLQTLAAWLEP